MDDVFSHFAETSHFADTVVAASSLALGLYLGCNCRPRLSFGWRGSSPGWLHHRHSLGHLSVFSLATFSPRLSRALHCPRPLHHVGCDSRCAAVSVQYPN